MLPGIHSIIMKIFINIKSFFDKRINISQVDSSKVHRIFINESKGNLPNSDFAAMILDGLNEVQMNRVQSVGRTRYE
jgi:hypothetical protein